MNRNTLASYKVRWVQAVEFPKRKFPLVFMINGEVSYSLTSYLANEYKLGRAKNTSSLRDLFRVVAELTHYYLVNENRHDLWADMPHQLVTDYFGARYHGTIVNGECRFGLYWNSVKYPTIKKMINAFKGYEKFCTTYLNTESMNLDEIIPSHVSRYHAFTKESGFNILSHLESSTLPLEEGNHTSYSYENNSTLFNKEQDDYKHFNPDYIFEFIENEKDLNYKAAYLLCAFCGLRISEALQIMITDIVQSPTRLFHEVILSEPFGKTWDIETKSKQSRVDVLNSYANPNYFSEKLSETELEYLRAPAPRVQEVGKYQLGWKGITVNYSKSRNKKINKNIDFGYTLEWSNDFARVEFERIVGELLAQPRANHPFLLCKKNNGAPMTYGAYYERFKRHSFKLTGEYYTTHSLRHFCGAYLANAIEMRATDAQVFLRHKSFSSTEVYYNVTGERMRKELKQIDVTNSWTALEFTQWSNKNAK
jgi:integrase